MEKTIQAREYESLIQEEERKRITNKVRFFWNCYFVCKINENNKIIDIEERKHPSQTQLSAIYSRGVQSVSSEWSAGWLTSEISPPKNVNESTCDDIRFHLNGFSIHSLFFFKSFSI